LSTKKVKEYASQPVEDDYRAVVHNLVFRIPEMLSTIPHALVSATKQAVGKDYIIKHLDGLEINAGELLKEYKDKPIATDLINYSKTIGVKLIKTYLMKLANSEYHLKKDYEGKLMWHSEPVFVFEKNMEYDFKHGIRGKYAANI